MGAQVEVDGNRAIFNGVDSLKATTVKAVDVRAGAAMVIAALVADGITEIENVRYIERGYEDILEKLSRLGAEVERVTD